MNDRLLPKHKLLNGCVAKSAALCNSTLNVLKAGEQFSERSKY